MASSEELQTLILVTLDRTNEISDTSDLQDENGATIDQLAVQGALNSLLSKEMVLYTPLEKELWVLTSEGEEIANAGSHEARVFEAIPSGDTGLPIPELQKIVGGSAKFGQGAAFKNKWIGKNGNNLVRLVESIVDQTKLDLQKIRNTGRHSDSNILSELKKRKLVEMKKVISYKVTKGGSFKLTIEKQATDLTLEMIQSGEWKEQTFKKYNFNAVGSAPTGGHLHPLMKTREEFRSIFFEMGFEEMPTNRFVESSFWNFDALFQPQQHPARDAHDTFFLEDPATSDRFPQDLMERIKAAHENGGDTDSIGYQCDWKKEEAEKLILRTHTTAVSSNMLYLLAQQKEFQPAKYFSIDRVFRNESVDATHLAEFHQVEGVIADYNLTLGDLIGFMDIFFRKMGIEKIRWKPAYNPYTEPSMEIFAYHPALNTWMEVGNSGMFRPEMLIPLGLPKDVRVIAWGLGLERQAMLKFGISNIRDILGHKVNLADIARNPVCRLDKHVQKDDEEI